MHRGVSVLDQISEQLNHLVLVTVSFEIPSHPMLYPPYAHVHTGRDTHTHSHQIMLLFIRSCNRLLLSGNDRLLAVLIQWITVAHKPAGGQICLSLTSNNWKEERGYLEESKHLDLLFWCMYLPVRPFCTCLLFSKFENQPSLVDGR